MTDTKQMINEIEQFLVDHKEYVLLREHKYFRFLLDELKECQCMVHPDGDTYE